ncbi:GNAT family N-acetyltransferase [Lutimonas vermicola]|uniref:GNAT family N-acetyltransferase n=1 Tax=Lutimonas vermicola TaxID=414288 RepID=A0ABU9L0A8_9FLAO
MIKILEISTKKELKQFVKFPFTLYKGNKYWVPPIISEEVESFDKLKNPVFEHADARFFLAYRNGMIVGRVAAIINKVEIDVQKVRRMRFGWIDFIDDLNVSRALLDKVIEIGRMHQLEFIEGPLGFSNLDKVGVLTEGFDSISTMITWYNHPYYAEHFKSLGLKPAQKFIESNFHIKNVDIEKYKRYASLIKDRYNLKAINFKTTQEVMPYAEDMFDLFNTSYAKLSSFVPVSDQQIAYLKKKFINFVNPEYIKFIIDKDDRLITFSITMPSYAEALQKANGKLFPTGFMHLLKAKKSSKASVFFLIGILPEYQRKGVTAIIFDEFFKTFKEKGVEKMIITPELEENKDIQLIWKNFKPQVHKRRCTMRKDIN